MDGVESVVTAVLGRLQTAMPGKLAELRTRYAVTDGSLEEITTFMTHEPDDVGVDRPPMCVITEQESDTVDGPLKLTGDGHGGSTFKWRYRLGVFAWARGSTFEQTATARQRYGLAVREILLQQPGLGHPDPGSCVLDPASIVETYSSIARDGTSREVIAATALVLAYETQELLGPLLPPTGIVQVTVPAVGVGTTPDPVPPGLYPAGIFAIHEDPDHPGLYLPGPP